MSETPDVSSRRRRDRRRRRSLKQEDAPVAKRDVVFAIDDLSVSYGSNLALNGVTLDVYKNLITASDRPVRAAARARSSAA